MSNNAFLADDRDIKFTLFEHLKIQSLFDLPYFEEHDQSLIEQMLDLTLGFCADVLGPLNRTADKEGCTFDNKTLAVTTPKGTKAAWDGYVENGFMVVDVPMEQGGIQAPTVLGVMMAELLSGSNPAFMMYPGLSRSASHLLREHGTDWMREVIVEKMHEGAWAGTMCLTEPAVGTAVGDLVTTARRGENGEYFITGTKQWVSGGEQDLTENIIHLLLARLEDAPKGMKGVSMFVVPRQKINIETGEILGDNDVKCIGLEHKMGINGNSTALIQFGDEGGAVGYLIGEENRGIEYMFMMMNEARIGVGVQALGQASVAFLNAEAYAKTRIQGTAVDEMRDVDARRVPIIEHPDVRRMLLRQRAIVEGGRALSYRAGFYYDLSVHAKDEEDREMAQGFLELLTPIVKAWCSDMGYESVVQSIQTYGGYGYTEDYPVEQIARDMKICSIYEGTNGIQALDLVGRKMRMKGGMLFMGYMAELQGFAMMQSEHPAVGKEVQLLAKTLEGIGDAAMHIAERGMEGDQAGAVLNAYPFLLAFGHSVVAQLLLEQAIVAQEALDKGEHNEADGRFYRNKIRTAQFFAHSILPEALAQINVVKSMDRAPIEFEFEMD